MSNKIPLCDTRGHAFADECYNADDRRCMHCDQLWSTLRADAQALADVRTLDEAYHSHGHVTEPVGGLGDIRGTHQCRFTWAGERKAVYGNGFESARHEAAEWVRKQTATPGEGR